MGIIINNEQTVMNHQRTNDNGQMRRVREDTYRKQSERHLW